MNLSGKRYWLVGASEGLGLALAEQMHAAGARLVLSARNAARLDEVCQTLPGAEAVPVDVADDASVAAAAARVGAVDGLVWLAGVYWPMPADGLEPAQFVQMCDVNFTGCARVLGAVLPGMVARGEGHIVLTGSLSGFRGLPGAMGYQASKAGVMALAECLQADLRGSGIRVQLANPGFIKTRLTALNNFSMPFLMEPAEAAGHMMRLMQGTAFKKSFPAVFSWVFRLSQFLPDWAYYPLFAPRKKH
ncbi:SDR family NAD(P)-dependent oxidoreductase [bacterium]|nr:SDR family NAD(P)-dependent oxidoreductase [bacterium]